MHKAWPCTVKHLETRAFVPFFQYCKSKCAEIRFTLELAKRLKGTGITANCLHPGVIDTGIYRYVRFPASLFVHCFKLCMKTVDEGILTNIYCITAEELKGVSGKYFVDCTETALAGKYMDEQVNKEFWEATRGIVQLTDDDPII